MSGTQAGTDPEIQASNHAPKARILIADDEPFVGRILERWLIPEGYECVSVGDGVEAWEALQDGGFSLLISDVMMPNMDGMDLLVRAREYDQELAVIMVTALDDRETAIAALQSGAFGYIIKPFDQNEVLINVASALERRRLAMLGKRYQRQLEEEVRQRTSDVRRREEEIIMRLVWASEFRDDDTGSHIKRIALYAGRMATALGWDQEAVDAVRLAAPMHDIGKIGVPDFILLKAGPLTEKEFAMMKKHTEIGAGILAGSNIATLHTARDIAIAHHERWDGSGYPNGAAGTAIPRSARLVAIADVYDALITDRIYRPALPEEKALEILLSGKGSHFDPEYLECFMDLLPEIRQIKQKVKDELQ